MILGLIPSDGSDDSRFAMCSAEASSPQCHLCHLLMCPQHQTMQCKGIHQKQRQDGLLLWDISTWYLAEEENPGAGTSLLHCHLGHGATQWWLGAFPLASPHMSSHSRLSYRFVHQKSCCVIAHCVFSCAFCNSCAMCWILMLLSSGTPCKLWRFGTVKCTSPVGLYL